MSRQRWIFLLSAFFALVAAGTGVTWEKSAETHDDQRYKPRGNLIDVGHRRLHLWCEGKGPGPTIVMLAGGGTPSVASYALQDRIAAYAHVCSYDRAGLGWSDPAPKPLSLSDQVLDLKRLLERSEVSGPFVLVPESFGALIALEYAGQNANQVAAIVFVDGVEPSSWFAYMADEGPWRTRLKVRGMKLSWRLGIVRLLLPWAEPTWVESLPSQTKGEFRSIFSRPNGGWGDALDVYENTLTNERPTSVAGSLGSIPIAVIRHGKHSEGINETIWPSAQARLAKLTNGPSKMIVASDAGHPIAQEQPDFVARVVYEIVEVLRR
ncbi:MAG TPA: alpha/beta hydrolase [Steroidobacteraceae bacterium]|nr:alpha/beta hydrolase [Steroidobacteraceae bacterium]